MNLELEGTVAIVFAARDRAAYKVSGSGEAAQAERELPFAPDVVRYPAAQEQEAPNARV
jgi:hypothetical protein